MNAPLRPLVPSTSSPNRRVRHGATSVVCMGHPVGRYSSWSDVASQALPPPAAVGLSAVVTSIENRLQNHLSTTGDMIVRCSRQMPSRSSPHYPHRKFTCAHSDGRRVFSCDWQGGLRV